VEEEAAQDVRASKTKPEKVPADIHPPLDFLFPFLDLRSQFAGIREQIMSAISRLMESQQFILGPEVQSFEAEAASWLESRFAVSCASGSDALLLSLMAWGVGPEDEVIVPPFTFGATAGAVARLGARPVFVDIDAVTYNIDPAQIEGSITPRTRAIIPVHLFGLPADMDPILKTAQRHGLAVVEDAAQAIGARHRGVHVGNLGVLGCFSFFPSKNLGGAGDGGLIATQDAALAEKLRMIRVHGCRKKYQYEILGMNSRLDALQAAILRVKLRHLSAWTRRRQERADRYRVLFAEYGLDDCVTLPVVPEGQVHVYNQFVIRCAKRDPLREFLRSRGVPTEIYYPSPLHLQPAFAYLGYKPDQLPQAESACKEVLALPIYPELRDEQQVAVVEAIADFWGARD